MANFNAVAIGPGRPRTCMEKNYPARPEIQ